jgi:hypothetical protein
MINTSKFAFIAAVAFASMASPAFAHTKAHHHRHHYSLQGVYNHRPDAAIAPFLNPDSPEATGGGSLGYNQCTGHARC